MKLTQSLRMRAKAAGWPIATLKAWLSSCAHWRRMATGNRREMEAPLMEDCALCDEFYNTSNEIIDRCAECPIYLKTGSTNCDFTPYRAASEAYEDFGIESLKFRRAAHRELAFLESLLPKRGGK